MSLPVDKAKQFLFTPPVITFDDSTVEGDEAGVAERIVTAAAVVVAVLVVAVIALLMGMA